MPIGERRTDAGIIPIYTTHCPWDDVTPFAIHCKELYDHYRNGHLYTAGGIKQQPLWYTSAMQIIDSTINGLAEEERKHNEQRRKNSRNSSRA